MKAIVLGGSAAGVNTGAGCSGYLLAGRNSTVLIDAGPGTLTELRRHADFRRMDAIVISHTHVDHTLDLAALRFALAYNPEPPARRIPLFLPPGGYAWLVSVGDALDPQGEAGTFFTGVFDVTEYRPDRPLSVNDVEIRFHPTRHYIPCWAMRVSESGSRPLGYTADTGPADDLVEFLNGTSTLIAEATFMEPKAPAEEAGHLTAEQAGSLAAACGSDRLVLTHLWEEFRFERLAAAAARSFAGEILIARPGLAFDVRTEPSAS